MKIIKAGENRRKFHEEKTAYEKTYNEQESRYRAQQQEYYNAEETALRPIKEHIQALFEKYPLLEPEIRVEFSYEKRVEARVFCNEHSRHNGTTALSWDYRAILDTETGELKKESGSWSGLEATTDAELDQLEQSVKVLRELNATNWSQLLQVARPKVKDYVTERYPHYDDQFGQSGETAAVIQDVMGQNAILQTNDKMWVKVFSESPSQYTIFEIPDYMLRSGTQYVEWCQEKLNMTPQQLRDYNGLKRVKKENLIRRIAIPYHALETTNIAEMKDYEL